MKNNKTKSERRSSSVKKIKTTQRGRIRPFVIGMIVLVSGLLLDKSWWQVGLVILIVLFVEGFYRYRTLN